MVQFALAIWGCADSEAVEASYAPGVVLNKKAHIEPPGQVLPDLTKLLLSVAPDDGHPEGLLHPPAELDTQGP